MVVVGLLAIEELDLESARCSGRCSATSRSWEINEIEVRVGKCVVTDANGEAIFGVDVVKDESFIKGEVDDGARGLNNRRSGDAWSGIIRRGLINRWVSTASVKAPTKLLLLLSS